MVVVPMVSGFRSAEGLPRGLSHVKYLVRAVGIEPTLLSEPDFESGIKHHKILIILDYILQQCASVLINVLILVGNLTANSALRGPKKRFSGIGHASPTGSLRALYGA